MHVRHSAPLAVLLALAVTAAGARSVPKPREDGPVPLHHIHRAVPVVTAEVAPSNGEMIHEAEREWRQSLRPVPKKDIPPPPPLDGPFGSDDLALTITLRVFGVDPEFARYRLDEIKLALVDTMLQDWRVTEDMLRVVGFKLLDKHTHRDRVADYEIQFSKRASRAAGGASSLNYAVLRKIDSGAITGALSARAVGGSAYVVATTFAHLSKLDA